MIQAALFGQERSSIFGVLQVFQGRGTSIFRQGCHQQQFTKKRAIGILPTVVTPNLSCHIRGKEGK
jgi:hypothetical protein